MKCYASPSGVFLWCCCWKRYGKKIRKERKIDVLRLEGGKEELRCEYCLITKMWGESQDGKGEKLERKSPSSCLKNNIENFQQKAIIAIFLYYIC